MKKTTTKAPFQNLKALIILNKAFGLSSCRLVNGRFKESSTCSYYYCVLWLLFHFVYSSVYYHGMCIAPSDKKAEKDFVLRIVRFSVFFASLLPYYAVAILYVQDFIKVNDTMENFTVQTNVSLRLINLGSA